MSYVKYIGQRLVYAFITLLFVTLLVSALLVKVADEENKAKIQEELQILVREKAKKGVSVEELERYRQEMYQQLVEKYGLNEPYWKKLLRLTKDTLIMNFGTDRLGESTVEVKPVILRALSYTVLLFTTSEIIILFIGILLGIKAAQLVGSALDRVLSILAVVTGSLPMWWLGMLMILIFSFKLSLFPADSMPDPNLTGIAHIEDLLKRMFLPVITIIFVSFGGRAWTTRNIMIGTLQEDFIMAARAKGVPERKVIYGHALRAAAPPILTIIIFGILGSLMGAIITESVFNWPGMGRLYWIAITQHSNRLIGAIVYINTVLYLLAMILADIAYGILDPRIRVGGGNR